MFFILKPQHHDKEYEEKNHHGKNSSTDLMQVSKHLQTVMEELCISDQTQESDRYYFCHYHGILWWANASMKRFRSNEDRGIIFTDVQLPAGASMERTYNALKAIQQKKPYKFRE